MRNSKLASKLVALFVKKTLEGNNGTTVEDAWGEWDEDQRDEHLTELEDEVLEMLDEVLVDDE